MGNPGYSIPRNVPLNAKKPFMGNPGYSVPRNAENKFNLKNARKKDKDLAEYDEDTAGEVYKAEFDQCRENDGKELKHRVNVDNITIDEVLKSCLDLEIDG